MVFYLPIIGLALLTELNSLYIIQDPIGCKFRMRMDLQFKTWKTFDHLKLDYFSRYRSLESTIRNFIANVYLAPIEVTTDR